VGCSDGFEGLLYMCPSVLSSMPHHDGSLADLVRLLSVARKREVPS
jgi:hypothetical protein